MVTPDAVWNIFFPPVGFMSKMDKKSLEHTLTPGSCLMEQVTGIEPALSAWEAEVLPLHHTCKFIYYYTGLWAESQALPGICRRYGHFLKKI